MAQEAHYGSHFARNELPKELSHDLAIRDYRQDDSEAAKALERSGSELPNNALLQLSFAHWSTFHAKACRYPHHAILVATHEPTGALVGVIAAAVKSIYFGGSLVRAAYVFDLRVARPFRRCGLGRALTVALEEKCVSALGAEYFYLSVNGTNHRARRLYTSLGWQRACGRRLCVSPLLSPRAASAEETAAAARGGGVRRMAPQEAIELVTRFYAGRDHAPCAEELTQILESDCCLGTFVASDGGGSRAALSLWHGSTLTGIRVDRLVLPASVWAVLLPRLMATIAAALAAVCTYTALHSTTTSSRALLVASSAITAAAGAFVYRWASRISSFRARAFAPVWEGPNWEVLMRAVRARVAAEARSLGFATLVVNGDSEAPYFRAVPSSMSDIGPRESSSGIEFWHKSAGSSRPRELQSDNFFDPRDM